LVIKTSLRVIIRVYDPIRGHLLNNLTNELQVMYRKSDIVTTLSVRLGWAGHLVRIMVGPHRKYFWANQTDEEIGEGQN
jgi:hypothetical protein